MSMVSSQGQVTIPVRVRRTLGLNAGTAVEFDLVQGGVVVRKASSKKNPVDEVFGILKATACTDDLLEQMRGKSE